MSIIEFLLNNQNQDYAYNTNMKESLAMIDDIDYVIDVEDIVSFQMNWEKYHHNSTWGHFGYVENDRIELIYPILRIDIEMFLKALKAERNNIDYELYVSFKRKYFHVKYRRKQ